jgi:hypothetical protein
LPDEVSMIAGGLDVHRTQITFDYLDMDRGESRRGILRPATRESFWRWLADFEGTKGAFVLEATTGWRPVVEELEMLASSRISPSRPKPRCAPTKLAGTRGNLERRADFRHFPPTQVRGNRFPPAFPHPT